MRSIIDERQLTPAQEDDLELRKIAPEKFEEFDPEVTFIANKKAADHKKTGGYRMMTREEVAELIAASKTNYDQPATMEQIKYPIFDRARLEEMLRQENEENGDE